MNVTKERKSMKNSVVCAAVLLLGFTALQLNSFGEVSSARVKAVPTRAAAPAPQKSKVTVPAGTRILIRTIDPIDSSKQKAGYRFTASLETNLQVDDIVVAPRGTKVYGRLAAAQSAGRMSGSSQLTLELTDIMIKGTAYPLLTSTYEVKGQGEGSKTAKKVVGGAGLGALIGGIAGGGKGAGIGALAGAGAGTAVAASKKGQQLSIPSESLLEFRLQQPAPLPVAG
jgi:outer membrane lipoprotein SlyB